MSVYLKIATTSFFLLLPWFVWVRIRVECSNKEAGYQGLIGSVLILALLASLIFEIWR